MAVEAALPSWITLFIAAAVDSINPCAIGVMILLVSTITGLRRKAGDLLKIGFLYIFGVYITYLAAGLGLAYGFSLIPLGVAEYISIAVAATVLVAGLIEIKDYFWYGQGISLSIPAGQAKKIHKMAKNLTIPGLLILGAFVAGVELPCTGGPYLAITNLLSLNFNSTAIFMLVIYNIIFVGPLIAILALAYAGTSMVAMKRWKQETRPLMRLGVGLLLVALGWALILIANGTINLG